MATPGQDESSVFQKHHHDLYHAICRAPELPHFLRSADLLTEDEKINIYSTGNPEELLLNTMERKIRKNPAISYKFVKVLKKHYPFLEPYCKELIEDLG